jgi:hypothetical protein
VQAPAFALGAFCNDVCLAMESLGVRWAPVLAISHDESRSAGTHTSRDRRPALRHTGSFEQLRRAPVLGGARRISVQ